MPGSPTGNRAEGILTHSTYFKIYGGLNKRLIAQTWVAADRIYRGPMIETSSKN